MDIRPSVAFLATAAVAMALVLAGCGSRGQIAEPPDAELADAVDCSLKVEDAPAAGRVPSDFDPVAVYRCDPFASIEDTDGQWSAVITERLEGDLGPLLAALDEPDDPRWEGACAAVMVIAPELWLVDADSVAIRAALPVDGCSQPKVDPVNAALAALTVTERSRQPLELIETRAALEAGCPTRWTPVQFATVDELEGVPLLRDEEVADQRLGPTPSRPSGEPGAPGAEVPSTPIPLQEHDPDKVDGMLLCRYASENLLPEPGRAAASDQLGLPGSGSFVDSRTLDLEDALTVLAAADFDVLPPIACTKEATEFVTLFPLADSAINGSPITVEVDGCQRVTVFGPGFTLASSEVLAIVS